MNSRKVLRVVVASPGDVARERDVVSKVFDEINRGVGHANDVLFEVWRWVRGGERERTPEDPGSVITRGQRTRRLRRPFTCTRLGRGEHGRAVRTRDAEGCQGR